MAIAGAVVGSLVWRRSYSSTAQLINYAPSSVDDTYRPRELSTPSLVVILQAPGLFEEVGSRLNPPVPARRLAQRLQITLDHNNDIMTVAATGSSPEESVDLVNRFCTAAIAYTQALQRQEATEAGEYVGSQLAQVESEIESTRRTAPTGSDAVAAALALGPEAPADTANDLPHRIQAAREQLEDLLSRYTDAYPLVRVQRARLAVLEEEQLHAPAVVPAAIPPGTRAAAAPGASSMFYGRVTAQEAALIERLRTLETNRALLIARQRAIQPFRENPPGYFRVLLPASANPTVVHRNRLEVVLFTCVGAMLGLFGSMSQVLLAEFLDNRIRSRADVRRVTGLPLLAALGDLGGMSPKARNEWAFRAWTSLRNKLSVPPGSGMVCAVISANNGDGRSTWMGLMSEAARSCGFRVLAITSPRTLHSNGEAPTSLHDIPLSGYGKVVEQLTSAECPPVVGIPLPSMMGNPGRRRQWRLELDGWSALDHVVIFVELPPASEADSVLLAEKVPNLVWLVDGDTSDSEHTAAALETLRDAGCNLVGAVLNRERSSPLRGRFRRWAGGSAPLLLLLLTVQIASGSVDAPATAPASFSASGSSRRAEWTKRMTLGPGDVLSFHFFGIPELTREEVPIGPDGRVSYLEAQNVTAEGLTVDELRDSINAELGKFRREAQAYVIPFSYSSRRYFVLGSVVQKGVFPLDRPITVIEAVARARGFETGISRGDTVEETDFSSSFLIRNGHRVPLDFERLFMHGDLSQNVALEPNDYLYFPAISSGQIYVLGEVGSPGPVALDSNVSALSAIASRGGFTPRAWKTHVLVVRGSLDHPVAFKVDIAGALTGDSPNLALRPGDLVYVSDRPWIRGEELLDRAASAFVESAVVTWTGINVGPAIFSRPSQ